jgi:hypothetical protein
LALRLGAYGHHLYNIPARAVFEDIGPFREVYLDEAEIAAYTANEPTWLSRWLPWR